MNKAIFLDRDGTINVDKHYLYQIEEFEFLPGVFEGLRLLQAQGYLLIIITNQSGIGRGYYSEKDFLKLNSWMLQALSDEEIQVCEVYYCPHLPDAKVEKYRVKCECRKPELGMYQRAVREYDIDLSHSFAIGDKISDCAICANTECCGFLIGNKENEEMIKQVKAGKYNRVEYVADLYEAALRILRLKEMEEQP